MTTAKTAVVPGSTAAAPVLWINRSLEVLWLLAAVLVPLAFFDRAYAVSEAAIAYVEVPKVALLRTLAGLMAVLCLIEWAVQGRFPFAPLRRGEWGRLHPGALLAALAGWLRDRPVRWLFLAVWFYLATTLLSTIVSASLEVSLWGEIPGQDSYPAYTVAAYLVLFGVIATHLRTRPQLWRLLGGIVTMGVVVAGYGVLQHYGRDFLDLTEITGGGILRVTTFMGNTLFAASLMLMAISVSVMMATVTLREPVGTPGTRLRKMGAWMLVLAATVCWMVILAVQLLGITFTFSRGPWLGTIVVLLGFLSLAAAFVGWRALFRGALVLVLPAVLILALVQGEEILSLLGRNLWLVGLVGLAAALVLAVAFARRRILGRVTLVLGLAGALAVAVVLVPSWFKGGAGFEGGRQSPLPATGQVVETFASIGGQVSRGSIGGREEIWKGSWGVIRDRPWFAFDSLSLPWIRPLLGYGPDLFRYTFLLRSPLGPPNADFLPAEADQAHNYFIHQAVEQGFLGLLSSLGIFVALFGVGVYQLLRERHGYSTAHKLLLIGLLATMAGRFVEQMTGVARVSDLTLFWILLAIFAALPAVMRDPEATPEPAPRRRERRRRNPGPRNPNRERHAYDWGLFWRLAVVAWLVGGIAMVTWVKGFNYPRAAVMMGQGVEHYRRGEFQASLAAFDRATELAPDVPIYHTYKATVYSAYRRYAQVRPERECSLQTTMDYQVCLAVRAYLNNQQALEQRPFYWRSRVALAESAFSLRRYDEAVRLHQEALALAPTSWPLRARMAEIYIKAGRPELALEPLEESLAITKDTAASAPALFYLGRAYRDLGKLEQVVQPLVRSLELAPDSRNASQAHLMLSEVYHSLGQLEPEQKHRERLAEIYISEGQPKAAIGPLEQFLARTGNEPRSARVYYLQGRAYLDLGDLERASESLERSLELGISGDEGRAARNSLGEIYARLGRLTLMEKHREQLVQDYLAVGDLGSARYQMDQLAAAYLEGGQPGKALEPLQRSLALALAGDITPSSFTLLLQGLAYLGVGEREKAAESLERSLRLRHPSDKVAPQAQRVLAEVYAQLGRLDLAKAHLKSLAEAYLEAGQPKEALEALQGLTSETAGSAGSAEVSFLLGLAYRDLGQLETSIQYLKRSLELSPSGETARQAHRTLLEVYAQLGRLDLAKAHLKSLVEAYLEAGRPKEALEALQGLTSETAGGAGSAEVSLLLGLAYRDLGQLEKSVQSLNRSLELSPLGETARQAHRTLWEVYAKLGRDGLAKTHRRLYQELGGR